MIYVAWYYMADGRIVAENFADILSNGTIRQPISITADGVQVGAGTGVWTNTTPDGAAVALNTDCQGWLSNNGADFAGDGNDGDIDEFWTLDGELRACNVPAHLYCFQQ